MRDVSEQPYYWTEREGSHAGLRFRCTACRVGHRCGYVEIPPGHPLHGLNYQDAAPGVTWDDLRDEEVGKRGIVELLLADPSRPPTVLDLFDVHGSVTFAGTRDDAGDWWIGFDCGHGTDLRDASLINDPASRKKWTNLPTCPGAKMRDTNYVEHECKRLAQQIVDRYGARPGDSTARRIARDLVRRLRMRGRKR